MTSCQIIAHTPKLSIKVRNFIIKGDFQNKIPNNFDVKQIMIIFANHVE